MSNDKRNNHNGDVLSDAAMSQLYRGELGRSDRWRTRLDTTTNWAITTTAATISFGFANVNMPHVTILVGIWLVTTFLFIEARRYRYYDLWIRRVRLLEGGYWAPMLRHEPVDPDALKELAMEMERPQLQLSLASALQTRLNRAYGPILLVLMLTWFVKIYTHPTPASSFADMVARAHVGALSGVLVMGLLITLFMFFIYLFIASFFTRAPVGELRARPVGHRTELWARFYRPYATAAPRLRPPARPSPRAAPPPEQGH